MIHQMSIFLHSFPCLFCMHAHKASAHSIKLFGERFESSYKNLWIIIERSISLYLLEACFVFLIVIVSSVIWSKHKCNRIWIFFIRLFNFLFLFFLCTLLLFLLFLAFFLLLLFLFFLLWWFLFLASSISSSSSSSYFFLLLPSPTSSSSSPISSSSIFRSFLFFLLFLYLRIRLLTKLQFHHIVLVEHECIWTQEIGNLFL